MTGEGHRRVDKFADAAIRVAVGDERRLIADAFAALIGTTPGLTLAGVMVSETEVSDLDAYAPDVVLVGVDPLARTGFALLRAIRARCEEIQVAIVADALDPALVSLVLEQRLGGLLLTDVSADHVATSLEEIVQGRAVMPVGWQGMLPDDRDDPVKSLSTRQLQVLELLAAGCSYDEIARRLFITMNTVKYHVRTIFLRLGVGNRMAAARILAEHSAPETARRSHHV